MNPVQAIQSIFQTKGLNKASMVSLKPGQLVYGRVEKSLPDDEAIIRIGDLRVVAVLKTDLSAAESYLFEVRPGSNQGVELKVVEGLGQNQHQSLLKGMHLPETKLNSQLVHFFFSKNLPFTKEQLKLAASWINSQTASTKELTALEWMIKKDLPFTKRTFDSLAAVQQSQSLYNQLEDLNNYLSNSPLGSSKTIQLLKQMIDSIIKNHSVEEMATGTEVKQLLKDLIQSIGLNYENEVREWANQTKDLAEPLQSLKQLVMKAMTELGSNGKELESLLHRLTGMQLLSQDLSGPVQQVVMQLPFFIGEKKSDVTLQWSGRKTSNGQIDPDYCRILFDLDLQSLNKTVIDMQVQNKVIHLSIINDSKGTEPIVKALTPKLREILESIGYSLSFIKVDPSVDKTGQEQNELNPIKLSMELYKKVDIKI